MKVQLISSRQRRQVQRRKVHSCHWRLGMIWFAQGYARKAGKPQSCLVDGRSGL